jgi:hypothetical protein
MGEALLAVLLGKGRIGSLRDPLVRTPDFFCSVLNKDKIFVDEALQAYRDKTGDMRPFGLLPVAVTSQILREAQRLKGFQSEKTCQPTASDEFIDT